MTFEYRCGSCLATGCKLWRLYQSFRPNLKCAVCACVDQERDASKIDADGLRPSDTHPSYTTDQIGWYIPALPTTDGFWGYCYSPDDALAAWKALPTLPNWKDQDGVSLGREVQAAHGPRADTPVVDEGQLPTDGRRGIDP